MNWKHPPIIKIYEALGAVADGRVEVSGNAAKIYSSTGNKFYDVSYDPARQEIMTNDNGSFWQGYLGYPSIAYLMKIGTLPYDEKIAALLKKVAWKDINQKFKNDFEKTLEYILLTKTKEEIVALKNFVEGVDKKIEELKLGKLGKKISPPTGY